MAYTAFLIFPNQLFENIQILKSMKTSGHNVKCFLLEEPLFFSDKERIQTFNGLKLLLHRASMKSYADYLASNGMDVEYID